MDKRIEANLRVKQNITDALFSLMQSAPLGEITVSDIIRKAGVARASFYRNYKSKEEVITVFIGDILERFRNGRELSSIDYMSKSHVKKVFIYFKKYKSYFMDLYNANLISLALEELNGFQAAIAGNMPANSADKYSIYFYMGAMFNMALEWVKDGAKEDVDDMVRVFCEQLGIRKEGEE
ncbi:MAG: TetR/AcrR family transcriptional regulator [Clostridia bacterium]|nr:TetR/AcrR family transcriptional regulator [Clostridia bacterium]